MGSKPLRETIGGVVNIALGFLGILATLLILWGGFKWMTSQGNSEQVDQAKKIIGAGVVGLVIILTAYAISRFVLQSLYNETI
ncbi:pilin [Patescibacteria group bacterium]|nr:pilin [Patescibacteria group bacterium]